MGTIEPLIFQGTVDQMEAAGDYVPLLRALQDRRANQMIGAVFALIFGAWTGIELWRRSSQAILGLAVLVILGVVFWQRATGREAFRTVTAQRRDREKFKAKGKYKGTTPFRMELAEGECRVSFQDRQSRNIISCRLFRRAVECEEVIWVTGRNMPGLVLDKSLMTQGTVEDLRAWLRPHVKKWVEVEIPQNWKEAIR